ncbi:unnamed protein product, partial [marine sediment metagenome]
MPEKDDIYDWGHTFDTDDDGDVDVVDPTVWATKEDNLVNEAGLYGALSDVSDFVQPAELVGANEVYASGWDNDVGLAEKDDIYDYLHQIDTDDDGSLIDESALTDFFEVQLDNEAGLYGVLSDVSDFVQADEANSITEVMLKAVNEPTDEYALTYEATTGDFEWHTPSELITAGDHIDWSNATLNVSDDWADSMFINYVASSMVLAGGLLEEGTNAGTIKANALIALLRTSASDTGNLVTVTRGDSDNIAIPAADTKYRIILQYNSGDPIFKIQTGGANGTTDIGIGHCMKEADNTVHFLNSGRRLQDGVAKLHRRAKDLRTIEITTTKRSKSIYSFIYNSICYSYISMS